MARYLFTSSSKKRGGLFLLESRSGAVECLHPGPLRGLTRGGDGRYYAIGGYRNPEEGSSTLHRFDPEGWRAERVAEYPLADCHDLKWIGGSFYLAASRGNRVLRIDPDGRVLAAMRVVEDEADVCHVNCLLEHRGELLGSVFTLSSGSREQKRESGAWHTDGKLLRLDFGAGGHRVLFGPLAQPHSLMSDGDGVLLIESHTSEVVRIDLASGTRRRLAQFTGFLRGLAFGSGEAAVGVVRYYKRDRRRLRPLPLLRRWEERLFPFEGILLVDPRTWRVRRRCSLPDTEIYDILPLDPAEGARCSG